MARKLETIKNSCKKEMIKKLAQNMFTREMKRIKQSFKIKILNRISKIFPGWRFTIVSKKK